MTATLLSRKRTSAPAPISVEYADRAHVPPQEFVWKNNGCQLRTKWEFPPGVEIELAIAFGRKRHCCCGIVVHCRPHPRARGHYTTTVYFLEEPCRKLCNALRKNGLHG